ncbi:hypothetical protein GPECTOR_14g21 [Gonium pectorale]|uniref:O-fucosyltransferase family protein n=1 Tax=Gonium pectorale TaxID=33097 RepID=A0A150GM76_GONPE|nr:hypothetical protein GPECTOR_14g21 [Gonium pectorale]|eukprot:KXZ50966.1 hypothetical protein GPECTOR_14g21 [Gonium pectorale]
MGGISRATLAGREAWPPLWPLFPVERLMATIARRREGAGRIAMRASNGGTAAAAPEPAPPTEGNSGAAEAAPELAPPTEGNSGAAEAAPEPAPPTEGNSGAAGAAPEPAPPTEGNSGAAEAAPEPAPPTAGNSGAAEADETAGRGGRPKRAAAGRLNSRYSGFIMGRYTLAVNNPNTPAGNENVDVDTTPSNPTSMRASFSSDTALLNAVLYLNAQCPTGFAPLTLSTCVQPDSLEACAHLPLTHRLTFSSDTALLNAVLYLNAQCPTGFAPLTLSTCVQPDSLEACAHLPLTHRLTYCVPAPNIFVEPSGVMKLDYSWGWWLSELPSPFSTLGFNATLRRWVWLWVWAGASGTSTGVAGASSGGNAAAGSSKGAETELPVALPALQPGNRTLRFAVCNGYANQRLSVLYGTLLAKRLGRSAVLPVLVDNGLQRTDDAVLASGDNQVPFGDMYDQPYFIRTMAAAGVRVLAPEDAPPPSSYDHVDLAPYGWSVTGALASRHAGAQHLSIGCPLFKIMGFELSDADVEHMWAGLRGLRPNKQAAALVDRIGAAIVKLGAARAAAAAKALAAAAAATGNGSSVGTLAGGLQRPATGGGGSRAGKGGGGFNFVHLRIENDWVEHCRRWESIRDGMVRDNCYSHTDDIGARLALFGFPRDTPLYVGSFWEDVEPARKDKALAQLAAAGYTVVTSVDVVPAQSRRRKVQQQQAGLQGQAQAEGQGQQQAAQQPDQGQAAAAAGGGRAQGREFAAMIEYFLGMRAQRFIGNSVSTFAALGLMERRHAGRWAAYYNGGNVPLASMLPQLHRMPWVFTYNDWSPDYDYMLRGAVRSALAIRSLLPHCVFQGDPGSAIAQWLRGHNVTLISHTPAWRDTLLAKARTKAKENVAHSHLYKTPDMLVSTFQRVDLPVVHELEQYTYVLYTDADVFFRRPIKLDDFGLPLPVSVSMSYEFVNYFPYNAGIILANLPTMRQRYGDFIKMMLDNEDGLYYTNYGPADQGILNKFYEADLRARLLKPAFNAKPYGAHDPNAFIVHFHGPKPHELLAFLASGKCDFFTVCESAFLNSLCPYMHEYVQWAPDSVAALRLEDACAWLDQPSVAEVFKKKWGISGNVAQLSADKQAELAKAEHFRAAGTGAGAVAGGSADSKAEEDHKRATRLRRALSYEMIKAAGQQHASQSEAGGAVSAAAAEAGGGRRGSSTLRRGGVTMGARSQRKAEQAPQVRKQQGQGRSPMKLLSFDTAQAVKVDKAALEEAWGVADNGTDTAQQ